MKKEVGQGEEVKVSGKWRECVYYQAGMTQSIRGKLRYDYSAWNDPGMVVLLGIEGWNEDALHTLIQNR